MEKRKKLVDKIEQLGNNPKIGLIPIAVYWIVMGISLFVLCFVY